MNHALMKYLACPTCNASLRVSGQRLQCASCKNMYPVKNGIPVLVDLSNLPKHLQGQIVYFEKEDAARVSYELEPWQQRYVDNFLLHGGPKAGGLIVDNATGSGYMAIELGRLGFRVIATDLTYKELVKLKTAVKKYKLEQSVLLVCADSERIPVKTSCADGLVANAILEHLPHEREAINEMKRVLKKGAPLMLAMPLAFRYVWPFLWVTNMRHDARIGHLRRYMRGRILSRFDGMSEVHTYYTGSAVKIVGLVIALVTKNHALDAFFERMDSYMERIAYGASNVVSILRKQ